MGPGGHPFGLDFTAAMTTGVALGADPEILADLLPSIEGAILAGMRARETGE